MPLYYYLPWVILLAMGTAAVIATIIIDYREKKKNKYKRQTEK
jgi:hypothetical protein